MRGIRRGGGGRRRDISEKAIIQVLRQLGVIVIQITGAGIPDLLCYHVHTGLFLLEAKTGKGKLTPGQALTAHAVPFRIARTTDDAVDAYLAEVKKWQ